MSTLPHLTTRPDDLYSCLEVLTPREPRKLLSEHLRWLFSVLAQGRQPSVIVERSGGSLAYASRLMTLFPDARVVHLFRDGRECAVSMSRHARYKFAAIRAALRGKLGYDPYAEFGADGLGSRSQEPFKLAEDEELAGLMPYSMTRENFDNYDVPLTRYGAMWSMMIVQGLADLPSPPDLLTIDYNHLVSRPGEVIGQFVDFLGIDRDSQLEQQLVNSIRGKRRSRDEIGEERWQELTRACSMGMNRMYGRGSWM
jgi:putative sulfotransferase